MTVVKTAPEAIQEKLEALSDGSFHFACHPVFPASPNAAGPEAAADALRYPRLKTHLHLEAGAFLAEYTESRFDDQHHLPMIYLKMLEDERRRCPFVAPEGCRVYEDRPAACRIYPIAQATRRHRVHQTVIEQFFVLRENHCRGFEQERRWAIGEWLRDQGLEPYQEWNELWMELITHPQLRSGPPLSTRQHQMFFLAGYNLVNSVSLCLEAAS